MTTRRRVLILLASGLALLFLLLFIWPHLHKRYSGPPYQFANRNFVVSINRHNIRLRGGPQAHHAKQFFVSSGRAFQTLKRAFAQLANARSYKVVTVTDIGGVTPQYSVMTTLFLNSPARGKLFRCDVAFYNEKSRALIDSWTDITNEAGNWVLKNLPGTQNIAFLEIDNSSPIATVQTRNSYIYEAQQQDSHGQTFSQAQGLFQGQPATIITSPAGPPSASAVRYIISNDTGALLAMQMDVSGIDSRFTLNPQISDTNFDIPETRRVVPTDNIQNSVDTLTSAAARKQQ
jgi:hypothetical protein